MISFSLIGLMVPGKIVTGSGSGRMVPAPPKAKVFGGGLAHGPSHKSPKGNKKGAMAFAIGEFHCAFTSLRTDQNGRTT
jgi:hypothetical protein